jgi:shikimate kinase
VFLATKIFGRIIIIFLNKTPNIRLSRIQDHAYNPLQKETTRRTYEIVNRERQIDYYKVPSIQLYSQKGITTLKSEVDRFKGAKRTKEISKSMLMFRSNLHFEFQIKRY